MVYQTIADDLIWLLLEAASLIPPGHPMAAETAYRKDQFTATFLPAMALKVLNRAEVNAAKKGCRKDRDYKFTGSSQRSKDEREGGAFGVKIFRHPSCLNFFVKS